MAEQMRPASPEQAPDPSNNYERDHPEREAGAGSMTSPIGQATPARTPDKMPNAVGHAQDTTRSLTAQDAAAHGGMPPPAAVDHSMKDEEPLGWDQAPTGIQNPRDQRHPRTGGEGGTPDVGQDELKS